MCVKLIQLIKIGIPVNSSIGGPPDMFTQVEDYHQQFLVNHFYNIRSHTWVND